FTAESEGIASWLVRGEAWNYSLHRRRSSRSLFLVAMAKNLGSAARASQQPLRRHGGRSKGRLLYALTGVGVRMSIIGWIILGLIAGFIGSKIVNKSGEGFFLDIVLGIIGAIVGGFIFNFVGHVGVTGLNLWSLFVSVIGAIIVLLVYHGVRR